MMPLINALHMVEREERFTGARNAPITDSSHCRPIIPFCAHPPVFVGLSSSLLHSSLLMMQLDPLPSFREGANEFCMRNI